MRDFGSCGMKNLTSSANYRCSYYKGKTCAQARRELKVSQDQKFKSSCGGGCHYVKDKKDFIEANDGVTNFPYFMAETNYSGNLTHRGLMVVDECHNTELQLSKFVEVTISEHFAKNVLKLSIPKMTTQYQVFKWISGTYFPKLLSVHRHYKKMIEKLSISTKMQEFLRVSQQFELLDKHECKVNRFMKAYHKDNWVMNIKESDKRGTISWEFKPISIGDFSEPNLFRNGKRILLMSATVMNPDAFCEVLGIPHNEVSFISIPSPFPIENRPIIFSPIHSMSKKNIDKGLPLMVQAVKAILQEHKGEKGIIHCHSYKIAKYLKQNIRSRRLLTHDTSNRDKVLHKHMTVNSPTVLLSPSMQEGVDLKGDMSRFQILCKVPYPYLGDKLIRKRMNKWSWWYPLQTAKSIVQSVGRSVRTETDEAVTYILDEDWGRFWNKNKDIFPPDFKRCIQ